MKKLIIMFAALVMAVGVNAAACVWSGVNVTKIISTDEATSYTMYLIDASITDSSTMAGYLANGDVSYLSAATVTTTSGIAASDKIRWTKTFGDYVSGGEYTYYTVILNGTTENANHYMVTAERTQTAPDTGSMSMAFGNQISNTWYEMAPEPTSGLLALLGFAGLALRRRRRG